jgi:5,10-methylene-tetrahydrofolate dehydrogenase/methenyl tetrahydrofolate cyclohydrolase
MIKSDAVIIDAGTADANGKTLGDVSPDLYDLEQITITPQKGGVGPLTVCALFENVIKSAERVQKSK